MRKVLIGASVLALMMSVLPVGAQDDGARPAPNILQIYRESVKPGKAAAHQKVEVGWPKAFRASKNPPKYLAMTSITGPSEAWFLSGYQSFEAWEAQNKAEQSDAALSAELDRLSTADGELLENVRSIAARFRADLSHRPPLNMGAYRYLSVVTVRVRPGQQSKFVEMRKMIKTAHEKAGLKDYYSIFEVVSGMPGPTYLLFIPMKSMKEVDEFPRLHESAEYREALGGAEAEKKMGELASAAVINNENALFAFNPRMSVAPPEYALADPEFWNPKPVVAKTKAKTIVAASKPE